MPRPTRVVLVRPRNPLNIGACARAMANFGLSDLVVIEPYEPIWQEARSAPGAERLLQEARAVSSWEEAINNCSIVLGTSSFHQRPFEQAVVELPNMNPFLSPYPASEPLALVFGSERSGMSNEELSRCHAIVHIPTERAVPSMNLGQAVATVLYELRRHGWEAASPPQPAPALDREALIQSLDKLSAHYDYPRGYTAADRLGRIRQALQPALLPAATIHFFLSLTRHVLNHAKKQ